MMIEIEIPEKIITDTIISGCEGGIQDWGRTEGYNYKTVGKVTLRIRDMENDGKLYEILPVDWQEAIRTMVKIAPRHFGNMISNDGDAITGAVLIQCAIFGKIVYG